MGSLFTEFLLELATFTTLMLFYTSTGGRRAPALPTGNTPRAVKMAEPAYGLQQEIAANSGSALLFAQRALRLWRNGNIIADSGRIASAGWAQKSANRRESRSAFEGALAAEIPARLLDQSLETIRPSMHTQFLTALAR